MRLSTLSAILGTALAAVAACARDADRVAAQERPTDAGDDAPAFGAWGVETAHIDATTAPGDDFYRHVNGGWLESFKPPDRYSSYSPLTALVERNEAELRRILEDAAKADPPAGSLQQKIGDYYASYLDWKAIEARSAALFAADLAFIDGLQTHEDVARAFGRPAFANGPITLFVDVDAGRPEKYSLHIAQGGLGMGDRDFYMSDRYARERAAYRAYVARALSLSGADDPQERAAAVVDLEIRLAQVHWSRDKRRERQLTYNPMTLNDLAAYAPDYPWSDFLESAGLESTGDVVVLEDEAIRELAGIFGQTPAGVWRDYLKFHQADRYADVISMEMDDARFDFREATLNGRTVKAERWKQGVAAVNASLGEAVGRAYVDVHFDDSAKAMMELIASNVRAALEDRLEDNAWMRAETKTRAREKLEALEFKIGYPDTWRDYASLDVTRGEAYGNAKNVAIHNWVRAVERLKQPVAKNDWSVPPQTVHAFYSPARNELVFPAGILQPPFFDPRADAAANYGAIGAVLGHELSHGFDAYGRRTDADGMLQDWWGADDAERFDALARKLGVQYETVAASLALTIGPQKTRIEDIGDLAGLSLAYDAYRASLEGVEAPIINGYTGDQRFFLSWAQAWRRLGPSDASGESDLHPPSALRVNGVVRNLDAWYAAFGIGDDAALYLPPEERINVW